MTHIIHDNLEGLEFCSCPFCTWLWDAIWVDMKPESIEAYRNRITSSDWPIELTMQLRNGQSMASLRDEHLDAAYVHVTRHAPLLIYMQAFICGIA